MEELVAQGEAYLDIETTGLSPAEHEITIVGLLKHDGFHALIAGQTLSVKEIENVLKDVRKIYTYNGKRFDVPFIRKKMDVDIDAMGIEHEDLMYTCRRRGLRGGQKKIEIQLCLDRDTRGMSGHHAAHLGKKWLRYKDQEALGILVHYNEEDCRNLAKIASVLREVEFEEEKEHKKKKPAKSKKPTKE